MLSFLKAYKKNDPSIKSYLEIIFLLPGPRAVFMHRIARVFYRVRLFFIARLISEISRMLTGIEIHPGAKIGKNFVIDHGMGVVIGETSVVGDDCFVFHGVTLGGVEKVPGTRRHPLLKDGVVVGAGAKILGAVTLEENVKVGAGAVVLSDCPKGATMVGMPAKNKS
ncbi:MAG: serine O-acetyltransferase EpsC [Bdellovibrionales bacterium]